jgi:hypothetical protein
VTTNNQLIIQEVLEAVLYMHETILGVSHSGENTDSVCWEQNDAENNDTHRLIICTVHKILQRVNQRQNMDMHRKDEKWRQDLTKYAEGKSSLGIPRSEQKWEDTIKTNLNRLLNRL